MDVEIQKEEKQTTIETLFDDFYGEYEEVQIDWGNPIGREIW